jgi:hypothetical protein
VSAEELLARSLKLLQGAIRASGFTQTEIDDRIGRRRGYLSHVFQRRVDLKVIDLLRALAALRIEPSRFFEAVASGGGDSMLQLVAGGLAEPPSSTAAAAPETSLEDRVRQALRAILAGANGGI